MKVKLECFFDKSCTITEYGFETKRITISDDNTGEKVSLPKGDDDIKFSKVKSIVLSEYDTPMDKAIYACTSKSFKYGFHIYTFGSFDGTASEAFFQLTSPLRVELGKWYAIELK